VILSVMRASWTMLRRDRAALALSFAVPIVFFTIFAMIFGGKRDGGTSKVRVLVVDEDHSARSGRLLDALDAEAALDVRRAPPTSAGEPPAPAYDRAHAEELVREGEAPVALVVPAGFGAARVHFGPDEAGDRPQLILLADTSDPIAPQLVQGLLQKVAFTGLGDLFLEGGIDSLDRAAGGLTPEQRSRLDDLLTRVRERPASAPGAAAADGAAMPIRIEVQDLLGAGKRHPMVAFYAAGLGVMFLLFTAAGAGGALIEERESGTLDRLLSTRISMTRLLAGKLVYLTSLGLAQLVVMFVWGWALFGLELPGHVVGFLVISVPTALACSAFGLVLAAVCRTRKQLVAMSNLVILSISALGGSMFPRFLMPAFIQKLSLVAFNAWALEGFLKVFWREEPLTALWPEVLVLLLWTVALFALARRLARKWEVV
jgi:linearmycin/streptolysin S transport system permease protein